jgi:transcriptional regulator with XRE-family HTH domain
MILDMKLGANLIAIARQRAGLSQRALAERLAVPPSTVARWEGGEHAPSMDMVQAVARACGLELTYGLANGDDSYVFDIQRRLQLTPTERVRALRRTSADPLQIAAALYRAEVRYVLVGAVAAAARGWPILLGRGEYAIVPADAPRNLARLAQAAKALGGSERKVEDPYAGAEVTWRWPLAGDGSLAAVTDPIGTRGYRDLRRSARAMALQDAVVEVASLRDLIRMADANPRSEMRSFGPALWATLEQAESAAEHAVLAA